MAGLCSGLTEAVIINPFEVVKVKLQADRHAFKEVKLIFQSFCFTVYRYPVSETFPSISHLTVLF
jgi:hypothetical protein